MSATLIEFPRPFQHPLPPDAIPWKSRHVIVFPHAGAWAWEEHDEGGGGGASGLTKREALKVALDYVLEDNATLEVLAHDWYAVPT
jgi:hypothetical protein